MWIVELRRRECDQRAPPELNDSSRFWVCVLCDRGAAVQGDGRIEVFDASYGEEVDGLHSLAASGKGKDYAMNYRASGHYLVWRLAPARDAIVRTGRESTANRSVANSGLNSQRNLVQLISDCLKLARGLEASLTDRDQIKILIARIETAQLTLKADRVQPAIAQAVLGELRAALGNARTALSMAATETGTYDSTRLRVGWAAARLKRAVNLLGNK